MQSRNPADDSDGLLVLADVDPDKRLTDRERRAVCSLITAAPRMRDELRECASYLELKLQGFRQDYAEDHCIVQSCVRRLAAIRAALVDARS
jgi:hypothetical protein